MLNYHPLMGITIFLVFLIIAFFMGKKTVKKKHNYLVLLKGTKKPIKTDSISPDANWID